MQAEHINTAYTDESLGLVFRKARSNITEKQSQENKKQ